MDYITVSRLTKKYGELTAVDNLSFTVRKGEIFGFLGPNGAGKTTTLNVLSTLVAFDRGEINIAGHDLASDEFKIKALIGLVPQEIALYPNLTAAENTALFASLYGLRGKTLKDAVAGALEFVGLSDERKKRAGKMSGGMKRRLNIACGIAHKPELIIMDEPTVGVDARSRDHILQSIRALRDEGATIIYTSHYMPEVQALADRVAIIDRGRLAAIGTEKELLEYVTDRKALVIGTESKDESVMEAAASDVRMLAGVKRAQYVPDASELRLDVDLGLANIMPILKLLMERSVTIRTIAEDAPNLETTFLALTGSELNTDSANALPNEQGQSAYFPPKGGK